MSSFGLANCMNNSFAGGMNQFGGYKRQDNFNNFRSIPTTTPMDIDLCPQCDTCRQRNYVWKDRAETTDILTKEKRVFCGFPCLRAYQQQPLKRL